MTKRREMVRIGKCNKCGDCCREETLEERIRIYEAFGVPHKLVNQNCKLFDPATGLCIDYDNRPKDCRDFPMQPLDIIALPKCSYYFVEMKPSVVSVKEFLDTSESSYTVRMLSRELCLTDNTVRNALKYLIEGFPKLYGYGRGFSRGSYRYARLRKSGKATV